MSTARWADAEAALARADPALGDTIARLGPCTLEPHGRPPYEALFHSIIYQQLSGKAAETILSRLLGLFGGEVPPPSILASAPAAHLRTAGVSAAKAAALADLGAHAATGRLPPPDEIHALSDDEVIARLSAVRGIGPWTAQMYLIFGLGRPDVLPDTDLGVQEGVRRLYGGHRPTPARLREMTERWRPWRSIAAWYMWRDIDTSRQPGTG